LRTGQRRRRFTTVWSAIGDLPELENGGGTEVSRYTKAPQTAYQRTMRGYRRRKVLYNHVAPALSESMVGRITLVPEGGNWRDIPFDLLPAGMRRAKDTCHTKRYGRLRKRGLCCTILTKCDPHWGSYVHPASHRAISVREAARLQSFPDEFRFFGFKWQQFEQVGNAVPPLMAAALARAVRRHLCRYSD
jgi:DNA (cytosine-5)-methyltransferase 1